MARFESLGGIEQVPKWNPGQVADWFELEGFPEAREKILEHEIDGEALLGLKPHDITTLFDIHSSVLFLKLSILCGAFDLHRKCTHLETSVAALSPS
jgi:hypothetical protein